LIQILDSDKAATAVGNVLAAFVECFVFNLI